MSEGDLRTAPRVADTERPLWSSPTTTSPRSTPRSRAARRRPWRGAAPPGSTSPARRRAHHRLLATPSMPVPRWRRTPPCARRSSGPAATTRRSSPAARRSSRTWRRRRWPASSSRSSGFAASTPSSTPCRAVLDSRAAGRRRRPADRGARPTADRARASAACMFGIDPVTGRTDRRSRQRRARRPRAAGQRRGRRLAATCSSRRTARCSSSPPTTARSSARADLRRLVELSAKVADGLRRTAGRRVGDRRRRQAVAAAVAPGHDRDPRCPARADLRPGPGRRDLPVPAHRARARPVGAAAPRGGARSGAARRRGHRRRGRGQRRRRLRRRARRHRPAPRRRDPPKQTTLLRRLNPVPACRRLRGAWRVGRLRAALPRLAEHLLDRTDADLEAVPPLHELTQPPAHRPAAPQPGRAAGAARPRDPHRHAHRHRRQPDDRARRWRCGCSPRPARTASTDEEILVRSPAVLALTGPQVAPLPVLPEEAMTLNIPTSAGVPALQRQRHPARGAAPARALGPGAVRARRVEARRAAGRRRATSPSPSSSAT